MQSLNGSAKMAVIAKTGNSDTDGICHQPEGNKKLRYPLPVFFVVVTEFCERFAYYGMRAVLTIYMRNVLNFSDDLATIIYHVFLFLCYFLPIFGAILADSFVGKYTTVFALSSIFAAGNILLTAASTPPLHLPVIAFSLTGLALMAIGTGGIKPCVVALGGDQFILPHQERQLKQFFSIFFFAVSVGNMLSTVITPVLRSDVQCFNQDCYPLAFGIPAILMLVAIGIFVAGKPLYRINQPKDNIILRVTQCMIHACSQRRLQKKQHSLEPSAKEHWVDYAHYEGSKFDKQLIQDTKGLLRVLVYYLPVPMFWALYEQLGSRWTLQATRMDGRLGKYTIKPDQMQVTNAILMFIFIPVFETVLYPVLRKCNIFKRPLQRMGVGGLLAALSFFLAGMVETRIEQSFLPQPALTETHWNIINTLPCHLTVQTEQHSSPTEHIDGFHTVGPRNNVILHSITQRNVALSFETVFNDTSNCFPISATKLQQLNDTQNGTLSWSGIITTTPGVVQTIIVAMDPKARALQAYPISQPEDIGKSRQGFAKLRVANLEGLQGRPSLVAQQLDTFRLVSVSGGRSYSVPADNLHGFLSSVEVPPDMYKIVQMERSQNISTAQWNSLNSTQYLNLEIGGNYFLVLTRNKENGQLEEQIVTVVPPNEVSMLWLLPQYVVMAWAEILFIISGMEFSFTEAPASMKSVLQSCWHLTNAAGNLLVIIAAENKGHRSQATEFLIFSGLMLIDIVIFCVMASRYKYVSTTHDDVGKESSRNNVVEDKSSSNDHNVITRINSNDAQDTRL